MFSILHKVSQPVSGRVGTGTRGVGLSQFWAEQKRYPSTSGNIPEIRGLNRKVYKLANEKNKIAVKEKKNHTGRNCSPETLEVKG